MKKSRSKTISKRSVTRDELRHQIIQLAVELLRREGRDAVSTRNVAELAGIQPPTIYRLFGDKDGLLEAVAEYGFLKYMAEKLPSKHTADPIEALRQGWDLHIEFGINNPAIYSLMYGDVRSGAKSPAGAKARSMLIELMQRIAASGRLKMTEEKAADLVHAYACGTVFTLLSKPADERDMALSQSAREIALQAVTNVSSKAKESALVPTAIALKALVTNTTTAGFTENELALFREWLGRLIKSGI